MKRKKKRRKKIYTLVTFKLVCAVSKIFILRKKLFSVKTI